MRALLAALIAIAACRTTRPLELNAGSAEAPAVLEHGEELVVSLQGNGATGYRWEVVAAAPAVLDPIGKGEYVEGTTSNGVGGGGGTFVFRFRAARPGHDALRLVYRRPFEASAAPARTFAREIEVR